MNKLNSALVVTHIVYRSTPPYEPIEGPYTSVANSLSKLVNEVYSCQIPLFGFENPLLYGGWKEEKKYAVLAFLGKVPVIKYIFDALLIILTGMAFNIQRTGKRRLVVGVDPLSCLPLIPLKIIFGFKLVFYSVDFNITRFKNRFLQFLYEKSDELASRWSDQTCVVCQSLFDYKKENYGVNSHIVPNSFPFDDSLYVKNRRSGGGRRVVWTGSILTPRQIEHIFRLCLEIQRLRTEMEFWFVPANQTENFRTSAKSFNLHNFSVFDVVGQVASRNLVSQCDLGIALYDKDYGSTQFIEPIKIWEYMMCGLPFIISSEPSVNNRVKESGIAYFLGPDNQIPSNDTLQNFISPENLFSLKDECLRIAKDFDAVDVIERNLKLI